MPSDAPSSLSGLFAASTIGFQYLRPVLGASVYAVPAAAYGCMWSVAGGSSSGIPQYEDAVRACRSAALSRLADEAKAAHADGVLAATMTSAWEAAGPSTVQVQIVGTAVRHPGGLRPRSPFTSLLSAQDFARLVRGGWTPVAIVSGFAATHVHALATTPFRVGGPGLRNAEMDVLTSGVNDVRRRAEESLRHTAGQMGAAGVVGVDVTVAHRPQKCANTGLATKSDGWIIEASAVGTAVVRFRRRAVVPTLVRRITASKESS